MGDPEFKKVFPDGLITRKSLSNVPDDFKTDNFVSNYLKMVGFGCRKDLPDALLLDDQVIYILTETFRTASPLVRYFE